MRGISLLLGTSFCMYQSGNSHCMHHGDSWKGKGQKRGAPYEEYPRNNPSWWYEKGWQDWSHYDTKGGKGGGWQNRPKGKRNWGDRDDRRPADNWQDRGSYHEKPAREIEVGKGYEKQFQTAQPDDGVQAAD